MRAFDRLSSEDGGRPLVPRTTGDRTERTDCAFFALIRFDRQTAVASFYLFTLKSLINHRI